MNDDELIIRELLTSEDLINQKLGYELCKSVFNWNDRDIAEFMLEKCMIFKLINYRFMEYYINIFNGFITLKLIENVEKIHSLVYNYYLNYSFSIYINNKEITEIEYLGRPLSRSTIIGDIAFFIAEQNK